MTLLFWGAAWLLAAWVAALVIGRAVHLADIELEMLTVLVPDTVPEEWIPG